MLMFVHKVMVKVHEIVGTVTLYEQAADGEDCHEHS